MSYLSKESREIINALNCFIINPGIFVGLLHENCVELRIYRFTMSNDALCRQHQRA